VFDIAAKTHFPTNEAQTGTPVDARPCRSNFPNKHCVHVELKELPKGHTYSYYFKQKTDKTTASGPSTLYEAQQDMKTMDPALVIGMMFKINGEHVHYYGNVRGSGALLYPLRSISSPRWNFLVGRCHFPFIISQRGVYTPQWEILVGSLTCQLGPSGEFLVGH
jgi:hypothetical protein